MRAAGLFELTELDSAIQLCREALEFQPHTTELIQSLASVTFARAKRTKSLVDLEESVALYRGVLGLRLQPAYSLDRLLNTLRTVVFFIYLAFSGWT